MTLTRTRSKIPNIISHWHRRSPESHGWRPVRIATAVSVNLIAATLHFRFWIDTARRKSSTASMPNRLNNKDLDGFFGGVCTGSLSSFLRAGVVSKVAEDWHQISLSAWQTSVRHPLSHVWKRILHPPAGPPLGLSQYNRLHWVLTLHRWQETSFWRGKTPLYTAHYIRIIPPVLKITHIQNVNYSSDSDPSFSW